MNSLRLATSLSLALLAASVHAQSNNVNQTVDVSTTASGDTAAFTALHSVGVGSFIDTFTFNVTGDFSAESVLSSIPIDAASTIEFTSASLNGHAYDLVHTGDLEVLQLNLVNVSSPLELVVQGVAGTNATYSGTLNLYSVPEPSAWLVLASGLGMLALAQRRRRTP